MSPVPFRPAAVAMLSSMLALTLLFAPSAGAASSGPKLTVPAGTLSSALKCPKSLHRIHRDPVLLVPATAADPKTTYAWNYEITLPKAGYRFCTVTLPAVSLSDAQIGAQYVVSAVRTMAAKSGRKVAIIGMSQGGLQPRWALRFWPDLRKKVSDYIGLATPQHGAALVTALCASGCADSLWQMKPDSNFLGALNRGAEIFKGPDWSAIYSRTDDVVTPQADPSPSSALAPAKGVKSSTTALQSICPQDAATHIGTLSDPVATALVYDALSHPGPAKPSRLSSGICSQTLVPGLNKSVVDDTIAHALTGLLATVNAATKATAEPPLASYATR